MLFIAEMQELFMEKGLLKQLLLYLDVTLFHGLPENSLSLDQYRMRSRFLIYLYEII